MKPERSNVYGGGRESSSGDISVITCGGLLALVVFCGCGGPDGKPLEVTAYELSASYDNNEVAADQKYKDQTFLISGSVESITKGPLGGIYVLMAGTRSSVQCSFDLEHANDVVTVQPGSDIVVRGTCHGKRLGRILIDNCRIDKAAQDRKEARQRQEKEEQDKQLAAEARLRQEKDAREEARKQEEARKAAEKEKELEQLEHQKALTLAKTLFAEVPSRPKLLFSAELGIDESCVQLSENAEALAKALEKGKREGAWEDLLDVLKVPHGESLAPRDIELAYEGINRIAGEVPPRFALFIRTTRDFELGAWYSDTDWSGMHPPIGLFERHPDGDKWLMYWDPGVKEIFFTSAKNCRNIYISRMSWPDEQIRRAEERRKFGESVPDKAVLRKRFVKEAYEGLKRQFYKPPAGPK